MSTVLNHAKKMAHKWPLALKLLLENTIVVDKLASFPGRRDLAIARDLLTEFFQSMGLVSHKWSSSDPELMETIPMTDRAKTVKVNALNDSSMSIRTLGILWLTET